MRWFELLFSEPAAGEAGGFAGGVNVVASRLEIVEL
jgi:hypothetical protein